MIILNRHEVQPAADSTGVLFTGNKTAKLRQTAVDVTLVVTHASLVA